MLLPTHRLMALEIFFLSTDYGGNLDYSVIEGVTPNVHIKVFEVSFDETRSTIGESLSSSTRHMDVYV